MYVRKYNLSDEILVFSLSKEFKTYRNFLLELFADCCPNHFKSIAVYKFLNLNSKLTDLYIAKNMFREAVDNFQGQKDSIYPQIITNLEKTGLFYELGMFYNEFVNDKKLAIKSFLKAKKLESVMKILLNDSKNNSALIQYKDIIIPECISIMKTQITVLENIFSRYEKYRDRLKTINDRDDDFYNDETSFSYSVISDKTRGRPGGIYEKEFVLEKLASLGEKIVQWRESVEDLLQIFIFYNQNIELDTINSYFNRVKDVLRSEYYNLFKDHDYERHDNHKPVSPADISKYI